MDMIEGVRAAIKEMMLPELDRNHLIVSFYCTVYCTINKED